MIGASALHSRIQSRTQPANRSITQILDVVSKHWAAFTKQWHSFKQETNKQWTHAHTHTHAQHVHTGSKPRTENKHVVLVYTATPTTTAATKGADTEARAQHDTVTSQ